MRDLLELTEPRITLSILICTAAVCYVGGPFHLAALIHTLIGTALMASGAAALNQWHGANSDAKIPAAKRRRIPAGRIEPVDALAFGAWLSLTGFAELWIEASARVALFGLITLLTYIFVYRRLKTAFGNMHEHRRRAGLRPHFSKAE
jgi:protoheme IX farnesyltransferase